MEFLEKNGEKVVIGLAGVVIAIVGIAFGSTAALDQICERHLDEGLPVVEYEEVEEEAEEVEEVEEVEEAEEEE